MKNMGILGIVLGAIVALVSVIAIRRKVAKKQELTVKKETVKLIWLVNGIEFESYYIARRYAIDKGISLENILVGGQNE